MDQGAVSTISSCSKRSWPAGGRIARMLLVALVVVGIVGACTRGDSPDTTSDPPELTGLGTIPPRTPSPMPSPTPSPTPQAVIAPERPPEMERGDEAGAAAAAEYFLRLFSYVLQSGDLEEWDRISAQDCGFCSTTRDDVSRVYGGGGRFVGGEITHGRPEVVGFDDQLGVYGVQIPYSAASSSAQNSGGGTTDSMPAEDGHLLLDVIFSVQGWTLLSGGAWSESVR